eukprot:5771303-Pyramimonas_sp.AAC.2
MKSSDKPTLFQTVFYDCIRSRTLESLTPGESVQRRVPFINAIIKAVTAAVTPVTKGSIDTRSVWER